MTKGKIEEIADADYKVSLLLSRVGVVSKKYILEISKRRQIRGYWNVKQYEFFDSENELGSIIKDIVKKEEWFIKHKTNELQCSCCWWWNSFVIA